MEPGHYHGIPAKYHGLPARPFALAEGENVRRPEVVRRLNFDDVCLWARSLETALFQSRALPVGQFRQSIVPIELAQPGDQQVVVHSRAGVLDAAPLRIDFIAGLTSIISVVADRGIRARRRLPQLRELFLVNDYGQALDDKTLASMPGLASLSLGSGWGPERLDLKVLRAMPQLRELHFNALAVQSIKPLRFLAGLERLKVDGIAGERDISPLASLTALRYLHLQCWQRLRALGSLENLEHVSLMDVSLANLKAFKRWGKVRQLALSGSGLRSLEGIGDLGSLDELFLGAAGIGDLTPLADAKQLRLLKLVHCNRVADYSPLSALQKLRSLVIELGSISTVGHVPQIDFLTGLHELEEFELRGALIDDGRLDVLFDLPNLRRVMLLGDFGYQPERLRSRKPECAVEIIPPV